MSALSISNYLTGKWFSPLRSAIIGMLVLASLAEAASVAGEHTEEIIAKLEIIQPMPSISKQQYEEKQARIEAALKGLKNDELLIVYAHFNKNILLPNNPYYESTYQWEVVKAILDLLQGDNAISKVLVRTPPTHMAGSVDLGRYLLARGFSRQVLLRCIRESNGTTARAILHSALASYDAERARRGGP